MKHLLLSFSLLVLLAHNAAAQTLSATNSTPDPAPPAAPAAPLTPNRVADFPTSLDRLTQANHELLDLLKKQQAVLEDIQYDRRLQSRQISSIEGRLEETLLENAQLKNKVSNLEAAAITNQANASMAKANPPAATPTPPDKPEPPKPPSTYLPPLEEIGPPGTKSWHRLFTLSGTENKDSDMFRIQGRTWRVLWHNLDKPDKAYANTSALFINAFPKDDTIPQKVSSKLGTGGESTELEGPGNFYLRIEASGGSWELAVEDFR